MVSFGSYIQWYIHLRELLNAKIILVEEQL